MLFFSFTVMYYIRNFININFYCENSWGGGGGSWGFPLYETLEGVYNITRGVGGMSPEYSLLLVVLIFFNRCSEIDSGVLYFGGTSSQF